MLISSSSVSLHIIRVSVEFKINTLHIIKVSFISKFKINKISVSDNKWKWIVGWASTDLFIFLKRKSMRIYSIFNLFTLLGFHSS